MHTRRSSRLFEEILQGERVHHRTEHSHVVSPAAIHAALAELGTTEEVAATHHNGDLDIRRRLSDLTRERTHHIGIDPERSPAERFTRKFE